MTKLISVIIPTINEEANITLLMEELQHYPELEVIVADGGSSDRTIEISKSHGWKTISTPPGRGLQMNGAVAIAKGEILVFLHADTQIPSGFVNLVRKTLKTPNVALGAFSLKIQGSSNGLAIIEFLANLRSRYLALPYGDQVLFTTKALFERVGGFDEIEIMEDYAFAKKMGKLGNVVTLPDKATTSSRRWDRMGLVKTTLINQLIVCGFHLGVTPAKLAQLYQRLRGVE